MGGIIVCFLRRTPSYRGLKDFTLSKSAYFFPLSVIKKTYPCALVQWFVPIGDQPCEDTGMWMVELKFDHHGERITAIVHLETDRCACCSPYSNLWFKVYSS